MLGSGAIDARQEIIEPRLVLAAGASAGQRHRSGRGIVGEDLPYGFPFAAALKPWLGSDVLIAIGTRMELQYLRWRKFPPGVKIVRIDIDPAEMVRRKADAAIVTDARLGVRALIDALAPRIGKRASREAQFTAIKARSRKEIEIVQPQLAYLDAIRAVLPRDGFLVEEICQVGFSARFGFPVYEPRNLRHYAAIRTISGSASRPRSASRSRIPTSRWCPSAATAASCSASRNSRPRFSTTSIS